MFMSHVVLNVRKLRRQSVKRYKMYIRRNYWKQAKHARLSCFGPQEA